MAASKNLVRPPASRSVIPVLPTWLCPPQRNSFLLESGAITFHSWLIYSSFVDSSITSTRPDFCTNFPWHRESYVGWQGNRRIESVLHLNHENRIPEMKSELKWNLVQYDTRFASVKSPVNSHSQLVFMFPNDKDDDNNKNKTLLTPLTCKQHVILVAKTQLFPHSPSTRWAHRMDEKHAGAQFRLGCLGDHGSWHL